MPLDLDAILARVRRQQTLDLDAVIRKVRKARPVESEDTSWRREITAPGVLVGFGRGEGYGRRLVELLEEHQKQGFSIVSVPLADRGFVFVELERDGIPVVLNDFELLTSRVLQHGWRNADNNEVQDWDEYAALYRGIEKDLDAELDLDAWSGMVGAGAERERVSDKVPMATTDLMVRWPILQDIMRTLSWKKFGVLLA